MTPAPGWIAVEAGAERLRAWAMGHDGRPLARAEAAQGTEALDPDGTLPALLALVGPWLDPGRPAPVVACGLAAAWPGLPNRWRPVPCAPLGAPLPVPSGDPRLTLALVPGLSQARPSADLMSGDETRIAGVIAVAPRWDGVLCLPGHHSRWAEVSAGEVVSFRSALTGELFRWLCTGSSLRQVLGGEDRWGAGFEAGFEAGLAEGVARPEALAARLPALRAEGLLAGLAPVQARGRLAGLLVGAELAATRAWWLGREVVIVDDGPWGPRYARALSAQGVTARQAWAEDAVLAGLSRAHALEGRA